MKIIVAAPQLPPFPPNIKKSETVSKYSLTKNNLEKRTPNEPYHLLVKPHQLLRLKKNAKTISPLNGDKWE